MGLPERLDRLRRLSGHLLRIRFSLVTIDECHVSIIQKIEWPLK